MTKEEVRLLIKQRLGQLDAATTTAASAAICRQVIALPQFDRAKTVLLYAPLKGEPDIGPIFDAAFSRGRTVAVPRLEKSSDRLELWHVPGREQMQPGTNGMLQPDFKNCVAIDGAGIDFALVPGLAFNRQGLRLGRGGGYYDRLLAQLGNKTFRVGCFFACQESADLARDLHDQSLNEIVTEKECIQIVA